MWVGVDMQRKGRSQACAQLVGLTPGAMVGARPWIEVVRALAFSPAWPVECIQWIHSYGEWTQLLVWNLPAKMIPGQ